MGEGGGSIGGREDYPFLMLEAKADVCGKAREFGAVKKTVSIRDDGVEVIDVGQEVGDTAKAIVTIVPSFAASGGAVLELQIKGGDDGLKN